MAYIFCKGQHFFAKITQMDTGCWLVDTGYRVLPDGGFLLYLPKSTGKDFSMNSLINTIPINERDFSSELHFTTSRSSGPGGQNVNKVNTKVELRFSIVLSSLLSEEEKALLLLKLAKKINSEGEMIVVSQTERSQLKNKQKAIDKFCSLLTRILTPRKKRLPTTPSQASKEERLEVKRKQAEKKERRRSL
jgi:ribosome-associated protein